MSILNVDDVYDKAGAYKKQQVVQIVNSTDGEVATGTTVIPADDSIPQITEGNEFMTLAVTPKHVNNILKIEVVFVFADSSSTQSFTAALFQDSTAGALGCVIADKTGANFTGTLYLNHYMVAGTTSATTFKVRAAGSAGTTTFNGGSAARQRGGVLSSSITITEYQPS